jgi:hypothetical protein
MLWLSSAGAGGAVVTGGELLSAGSEKLGLGELLLLFLLFLLFRRVLSGVKTAGTAEAATAGDDFCFG